MNHVLRAVGRVGGDDEASPGWAIVKLGGTQHFVDLGATVAVRSDQLQVREVLCHTAEQGRWAMSRR